MSAVDAYAGMGQALYEQEAVFRHWVDECAELLQSDLGCDVREHLFPAVQTNRRNGRLPELRDMLGRGQTGNEPLQATRLAQTAVFVTEYALARLLQS